MSRNAVIENLTRDIRPGSPSTYLRPYLSAENYRSLVVDHCQLVEQFENLVVVVIQLWEMNNALRERLDLARQPLPIAASGAVAARAAMPEACAALRVGRSAERTVGLTPSEPLVHIESTADPSPPFLLDSPPREC
jgi:hypothetical protein